MEDYVIMVYKNDRSKYADKKIYFKDWNDLKGWLYQQSQIKTKDKKNNNHVLSGVTDNGRRVLECMDQTSKVYFTDIDETSSIGMSFNEFINKYKHLNHQFIAYNSASCRKGYIRFRIVFNLTRPVKSFEFLHFWTNLNKLYDGLIDPQTNHIVKTNACPRNFENALNFMYECKGEPVDVDKVKSIFIYKPKKDLTIPQGYIQYLKNKNRLHSKSINWSSVNDCPFIPKSLVSEYQSIMDQDGSGRFDLFYRIMVATAFKASKMKYDLTEDELLELMLEIDENQHQVKKQKNSLHLSVKNAINYAITS